MEPFIITMQFPLNGEWREVPLHQVLPSVLEAARKVKQGKFMVGDVQYHVTTGERKEVEK